MKLPWEKKESKERVLNLGINILQLKKIKSYFLFLNKFLAAALRLVLGYLLVTAASHLLRRRYHFISPIRSPILR